jgi:outer membrane protein W
MRSKGLVVAALVAFCLSGAVSQAWAEKGDTRIQFGALYSVPTSDLEEPDGELEVDSAFGFQVSFEYLISDIVGIEPSLAYSNQEVNVEEADVEDFELGDIDLTALTFNFNFHLLRDKPVDLFLGPTVGYAFWGDLESDVFPDSFPADDDFIYGANLGLDVPFGGSAWSFTGAINYLLADIALEGSTGDDLGVDPVQFKFGVSYSF